MLSPLFIFIDESGDFNFDKNGSKYYVFTAVMTQDPSAEISSIIKTHFDILSGKLLPELDADYLESKLCKQFHASEDKQCVRDLLFNIITNMNTINVNAIIIQKNKTHPSLREPKKFYSKFLGSLVNYIIKAYEYSDLCILVNDYAVNKDKAIFNQTVKREIKRRNPSTNFRIYFPKAGIFSHLQVVDYITWAIQRKWEIKDERSYDYIRPLLQSPELDAFKGGTTIYYSYN